MDLVKPSQLVYIRPSPAGRVSGCGSGKRVLSRYCSPPSTPRKRMRRERSRPRGLPYPRVLSPPPIQRGQRSLCAASPPNEPPPFRPSRRPSTVSAGSTISAGSASAPPDPRAPGPSIPRLAAGSEAVSSALRLGAVKVAVDLGLLLQSSGGGDPSPLHQAGPSPPLPSPIRHPGAVGQPPLRGRSPGSKRRW